MGADEAVKDDPSSSGERARRSDRPSQRPGGPHALIGSTLSGRYKIERLLGEGGMGAVYQAEHTHMRKRLAIKVLHPEMSRLAEVVARFEREAMAAAHIDHPNVAAATDFGKLEDGSFFLALEFVEGNSLRELIAKGPIELGRSLHIIRQIAAGLQRAHSLGIVHRDLKPENVMLVEREGDPDFVKVLDFGIAKVPVGELGAGGGAAPGQPVLTQLGMVYGTPEYMAPEQALGQSVDPRADLYALGVIGYEVITGLRPFNHESKVTLLGMHVTAHVPRMSEKAPDIRVPPEVEAIIIKLLAKEASERFADARELIDAITNVSAGLAAQGVIDGLPAMSMPRSSQIIGDVATPPPAGPASLPKAAAARRAEAREPVVSAKEPAVLAKDKENEKGRSRDRGRPILPIIGTILGLIVVATVAVVVATAKRPSLGKRGDTTADGSTSQGDIASADEPIEPLPSKLREQVEAARANIEIGNYAIAIETLLEVEKEAADRPDVEQLLELAYSKTSNPRAAMVHAERWLTLDPAAIKDIKLAEDVRNAALLKDSADASFALLESKMGALGVDILYDLAFGQSGAAYPVARERSRNSLSRPAVRRLASPELDVLLDFKAARSCDAKLTLLARAKESGDWRMVGLLKPLQATRGCGFLGRSDCYPCMHRDGSLREAIQAIEARTKK